MYFDLTRLMPDDGEILRQEVRPDRPISVALKCIALKFSCRSSPWTLSIRISNKAVAGVKNVSRPPWIMCRKAEPPRHVYLLCFLLIIRGMVYALVPVRSLPLFPHCCNRPVTSIWCRLLDDFATAIVIIKIRFSIARKKHNLNHL